MICSYFLDADASTGPAELDENDFEAVERKVGIGISRWAEAICSVYVALDIGGTVLKAAAFTSPCIEKARDGSYPEIVREASGLGHENTDDMVGRFADLILRAAAGRKVCGVGVSTPGIVHHSGRHVPLCAKHLKPLDDRHWVTALEQKTGAPCALINDAQSGLCGAAEAGLLPRSGTVGFLTFGTGIGFVVWKNGKLWNPGRHLPLLGSIRTPGGRFDDIGGVARLAESHPSKNLAAWLADPATGSARESYFQNARGILVTAAILYSTDTLLIGGGLVDAARAADFDLGPVLALSPEPDLPKPPSVLIAGHGNALNLLGAAALARGLESQAAPVRKSFGELSTEAPHAADLLLEKLSSRRLLELMDEGELAAARNLSPSLVAMAPLVDDIAGRMERGGRLIYVGSGTSGRLAALDAVEIPCTFGCDEGEAIAVIGGGSAEASDTIETDEEEDASSVPDMLLRLTPGDTVIGISAGGSARQVLSALRFARSRGAKTVLIRAAEQGPAIDVDHVIALHSGAELVQGSTRMKAGTATKRILNALSTAVMIRRGKIRGTSMIEVRCLNEKLRHRAIRILFDLYRVPPEEARALLESANWRLRPIIDRLESKIPSAS